MTKIDKPESLPLKDRIKTISAEVLRDFKTRGIHPLENKKIYDFLGGMQKAKKRSVLERLAQPERVNRIEKSLGEEYSICLFHPGIRVRVEDFIVFCKEQRITDEKITPVEAIARFSSHLGEVTLYRGIALTDNDAGTIQRQGIVAPALKDDRKGTDAIAVLLNPDTIQWDLDSPYPTTFPHDMLFRDTNIDLGSPDDSITISSSGYEEVASSVGWHSSGKTETPGFLPYLYTLRIPKLLTYDKRQIMGDVRGPKNVVIDGKTFEGEQLEIIVPFGVPSRMIHNVERTSAPPRWSWI